MSTDNDQRTDQAEPIVDIVGEVTHPDGWIWTEPPLLRIDRTHAVYRRGAPARVFVNDIYAGQMVQQGSVWLVRISSIEFGPFPTQAEAVAYIVQMLRASLGKLLKGVPR